MFSARKSVLRKRSGPEPEPPYKGRKRLLPKLRRGLRPRIGIRIWLTALFVLVTAFAGGTAYLIVEPILRDYLDQASEASFGQVGEQFVEQNQRSGSWPEQRIRSFATGRGVQWGIVRAGDGQQLNGNLEEWNTNVVQRAVATQEPQQDMRTIQSGVRQGQRLATFAAPIDVEGEQNTAVVFNRFYAEGDIQNVDRVIDRIEWIALLAGGLALLITGVAGYVAADLISRRISRLGVAADRLATGNFDERIETHIEDEVGSLGETFNAMAASLQGAFGQVEQEKERGRAILDGMTDAVIGVDKDLNAIFLNPRARKLLDASERGFHDRLQEILEKTRRTGPVIEPEVEAGNRIIEVRAAPLEEGALAILQDVTEERKIQRAKAEFIANASHELKTPLFALSGYLEMLEDEEDEGVRTGFLEEMKVQTERLEKLAKTLLDLSRLDANAVVFRMEEVDLEDLLHELRRDFGFTGRPVNIRAEEDVPAVRTDPNQLHRMLAILLDNALKYSDPDSPVDLDLSRENGQAVIAVKDHGCGIPQPELPHIFERFYRAQGSSRADGTGLGLALASEITDHLGGEIQVQSRQGAGSTFSVALPLDEQGSSSNH